MENNIYKKYQFKNGNNDDEQLMEVSVLIRQSKQPIVDHLPLTEK
jgi:hypothetical protein